MAEALMEVCAVCGYVIVFAPRGFWVAPGTATPSVCPSEELPLGWHQPTRALPNLQDLDEVDAWLRS